MNQLFSIITIARATVYSLLRSSLTKFLLSLVLLLVIISWASSSVDMGIRFRLFENTLLATQCLMMNLLAWFFSFDVLRRDESEKLYMLPLSTSISPGIWQLGRFVGVIAVLTGTGLLLLILDQALLLSLEGSLPLAMLLQLFLYILSACLSVAVIFCLAAFVPVLSAVIYAVIIWIIGNGLDELLLVAEDKFGDSAQQLSLLFYYLLPNFSFFDISSDALNHLPVDAGDTLFRLLYPGLYSLLLVMIAAFVYSRKVIGK